MSEADDAVAIVRSLAAEEATIYESVPGPLICLHCRVEGTRGTGVEGHEPYCVWRRAREWVAANPKPLPDAWLDPDTDQAVTHEPEDPDRWVPLYRKEEG